MNIDEEELPKKSKRREISQFIDDEAELSGDDDISGDEAELSDDDQLDPQLVDQDAKELDSDEEEEVRRLYHKQLETDDRRQILLLREHLEENEITAGQGRRRKFRWQTKELMENSLKRHYDPDDDDSQEGLDEDDYDDDFPEMKRLRRPIGDSLLLGSTKLITNSTSLVDDEQSQSNSQSRILPPILTEDSNSRSTTQQDMNRYLFRDREIVQALSKKETIMTREDKARVLERELRKVSQTTSVFDQLYS